MSATRSDLEIDGADAVIAVLGDCGGFDGWWDGIDEETREEITRAIGRAIQCVVNLHYPQKI